MRFRWILLDSFLDQLPTQILVICWPGLEGSDKSSDKGSEEGSEEHSDMFYDQNFFRFLWVWGIKLQIFTIFCNSKVPTEGSDGTRTLATRTFRVPMEPQNLSIGRTYGCKVNLVKWNDLEKILIPCENWMIPGWESVKIKILQLAFSLK